MRATELNSARRFSASYILGSSIGEGSFATVHECWKKQTAATEGSNRDNSFNTSAEEPEWTTPVKKRRVSASSTTEPVHNQENSLNKSKRPLAVKAMPLDAFTLREIKILREIKSPHLICLEDTFVDPIRDQLLLVYEHAKDDLQSWIHTKGPVDENTALKILRNLLKGLNCLHSKGIMHRDIKPANILLVLKEVESQTTDINHYTCKLADFGLARSFRTPPAPLTAVDKDVVTLSYRAPELLLGAEHYNTAIDIWSLGCVLAELLTGRQIFRPSDTTYETEGGKRYYKGQLLAILPVLGYPTTEDWPMLKHHPFAHKLKHLRTGSPTQSELESYIRRSRGKMPQINSKTIDLIQEMLRYGTFRVRNEIDTFVLKFCMDMQILPKDLLHGEHFSIRRSLDWMKFDFQNEWTLSTEW